MRWSNITEKLHFTYAIAQGCACETKSVAFAPAKAARLSARLSELFTTFCNGRVGCSDDFPFFANLSPVSWIFSFWLAQNCLSPHTACLICCTFCVLNQSCSGWRDGFIWSLLSVKQVQRNLIHTICRAGPVIHEDHKLLQNLHVIILNGLVGAGSVWKILELPLGKFPMSVKLSSFLYF